LVTLNASFSWATKVQPALVATELASGDVEEGASGRLDVIAPVSLAPLPPPQPPSKTATEQKNKCTSFN